MVKVGKKKSEVKWIKIEPKKKKKVKKWKIKGNRNAKKKKKKKRSESDGRVILDQVVTLKEVVLSFCYPFFCESRT